MSVIIPKPNTFDKILRCLGKKRGVFISGNQKDKFGPYLYEELKRESFFKALLRPEKEKLPEGSVDIYSLNEMLPDQSMNSEKI